jgi:Ca2+-binding RTX toxin-like protein
LNAVTNLNTTGTVSLIDKIVLDNDISTAFDTSFTQGAYRSIDIGTSFMSVDARDNIIYRKNTGQSFYDPDGSVITFAMILIADMTDNMLLNFGLNLMFE